MSPRVIGSKVYLGIDNFAEIILQNGLYVDKSSFIKEVLEDGNKAILIARPRRWGKTLNMSMLQHFLAANVTGQKTAGLFDKLSIAEVDNGRYMQHQGKYPVIFVSFKDIKCNSFADSVAEFSNLIKNLYRQHQYLAQSNSLPSEDKQYYQIYLSNPILNETEIHNSLKFLSELLYKHHSNTQVYILIDEYDTPLNSAYNSKYLNELVKLMKNMLSAALKGNNYLAKGIMTGIMRISKDSMLSGLNNLKVYTLLNKGYSEYFGFTGKELDLMFENQKLKHDEQRVKDWYNGYSIGGITMYNPWSILNCLQEKGELRAYWVNTGSDDVLRALLYNASADIHNKFQLLIEGKTIEATIGDTVTFDMLTNPDAATIGAEAVWGALLYTGYLTANSYTLDEMNNYICLLSIPNKEIRGLFKGIILSNLSRQGTNVTEATIKSLIESTLNGNEPKFNDDMNTLLLKSVSVRDYAKNPEAFYQGFMLGLAAVLSDDYHVCSNEESGLGYLDLRLVPKVDSKNTAIVFEFKVAANETKMKVAARQALRQIKDKKYSTKIYTEYTNIKHVIGVGIAFIGKKAYCIFR